MNLYFFHDRFGEWRRCNKEIFAEVLTRMALEPQVMEAWGVCMVWTDDPLEAHEM